MPWPHSDGTGWHALVIVAAETCFPEAGIEDLPMWAAAEVARGLTGPLRTQIATTLPDDPAFPALRDYVLRGLGATPDNLGAMSAVDRVYADRLLRGQVPAVITARCLAWYDNWRAGTAGTEITETAMRLADAWAAHPAQRPPLDAQIVELATRISGRPTRSPLENDRSERDRAGGITLVSSRRRRSSVEGGKKPRSRASGVELGRRRKDLPPEQAGTISFVLAASGPVAVGLVIVQWCRTRTRSVAPPPPAGSGSARPSERPSRLGSSQSAVFTCRTGST